jgi:ankyrin repeat protein
LVKQLVENDADVNKPGWTPLHYAASTGQVAVIEFLLDNSAYIDAESPNGSTPLMMAAMYGSPEGVKVLIQAGAELGIKNQLGLTALDFAVRGHRQNAKELIETALQRQAARAAKDQTSKLAPNDASVVAAPSQATTQVAPVNTPSAANTAESVEPVLSPAGDPLVPASKPVKTGW